MTNNKLNLTMEEMDLVVSRCISEEYHLFIATFPNAADPVHVTLEKGSSYSGMHMKFTAQGTSLLEAFNKCLINFPANPVGAVWDTRRLTVQKKEVTDGEFTEVQTPPQRSSNMDDDIPF